MGQPPTISPLSRTASIGTRDGRFSEDPSACKIRFRWISLVDSEQKILSHHSMHVLHKRDTSVRNRLPK